MEKSSSSNQNEDDKEKTPVAKPKRYWNPGSYKYYIKYPTPVTPTVQVRANRISNRQVKTLYLVSTAFKIAKIVAVVLLALILIGEI